MQTADFGLPQFGFWIADVGLCERCSDSITLESEITEPLSPVKLLSFVAIVKPYYNREGTLLTKLN